MKPQEFAKSFQKIHLAFYDVPLEVLNEGHNEVLLTYKDEHFTIENHIETRLRLTFPDYVGKIGAYRNLFGYIMKNGDNVCDTSDFIILTLSHAKKIHAFIQNIDYNDLKELKDL